jgi:Tol biopolymer transport system component
VKGGIFTANPDGTDVRQLTTDVNDLNPAWSANGRRIAFASKRDGNYEIYVMDADGQNQTRLTSDPAIDSTPAWSPDGRKIVFESGRSGRGDVWTMNSDGTDLVNLTAGVAGGGHDPAWSPDGAKIAFVGLSDFGGNAVSVMNADGSGKTNLVNYNPNVRDNFHAPYRPSWSPDGKQILFGLVEGGLPIFFDLQLVNADGTNLAFIGNGTDNEDPAFSPDGQLIVFHYFDGLYTVRQDAPFDATAIPVNGFQPDWQPIPREPQRADYRSSADYCRAERDFLGADAFRERFGTNKNKANAFGKCVSSN